jgi:hypothetical protein
VGQRTHFAVLDGPTRQESELRENFGAEMNNAELSGTKRVLDPKGGSVQANSSYATHS